MKQLRCISIMSVSIIVILFLYIGVVRVTGQSVITPATDTATSYIDLPILKLYDNGCECIKYDCGCCQRMEWDVASLNGTLCANASYLEYDYGISITVTFNGLAIINETVSARNPPPICVGEDVLDSVKIEVCLRIFDIDIESDKFHACFEILGRFMHVETPAIKLGCVNTKLQKEMEYIKNNTFLYLSQFYKKTKNITLPSVIMV